MIKVAIVGTNGLAQYIANLIDTQTSHQFIVLSRHVNNWCLFDWQWLTSIRHIQD